MRISTILNHIDSGHVALPEFQRGYVWNRDQVRSLFDSLYRRHPVGGLLMWVTEAETATHRGDGPVAAGTVQLLLDGQQRMTSLYGVVRGESPQFFDGNAQAFTGLRFHLGTETFAFHQPIKMRDDPLWIDVTELMRAGIVGLGNFIAQLSASPEHVAQVGDFAGRLSRLLGINDIELPIEEVTGPDKTLDVVVNIFNQVNSGGTKLSKGDLALAKICVDWPDARDSMKAKLREWANAGYDFTLDWLLRSVNTILTGEANFSHLHNRDGRDALDIQDGLERASRCIDDALNLISGRLGLDHDRVFFGRFGVPVMVRYLDRKNGAPDGRERDKLLFWFAQAGMWGRFSSSTETAIDQDLAALEKGGLDALIEQLRSWRGRLHVESDHFENWSTGARFYPVLYMLTRMGEARDWGTGLPLDASMLGKMNRLEMHHIFPKAKLYDRGCQKAEVNALANFCFLTKGTNLNISDRLPEDYFSEVEEKNPGVLASQWVPIDPELWKVERYLDFLKARRDLLAAEANKRFEELLHGDTQWFVDEAVIPTAQASARVGGITSEAEELELEGLNDWVMEHDLPCGQMAFDYANPDTGAQMAVFDLVWENGLQPGLTEPVAILLDESAEVLSLASKAGFRCFTATADFRAYVETEVLKLEAA